MKEMQVMKRHRIILALAVVSAAAALPLGCSSNDPDRTGDANAGIGAAGTNAENAPKTQEEARKQQLEQEEAFRKAKH